MPRGVGEMPRRKLRLTPPAKCWQAFDIWSLEFSNEFIAIDAAMTDRSVRLAWNTRTAAPDQKVQIAAPVRLQGVLHVEGLIARHRSGRRRLPFFATARELGLTDFQRESARFNIQRNEIPVAHECQRPAHRR